MVIIFSQRFVLFSDMYLTVGDHHKALEIMIENGWTDRSGNTHTLYRAHSPIMQGIHYSIDIIRCVQDGKPGP